MPRKTCKRCGRPREEDERWLEYCYPCRHNFIEPEQVRTRKRMDKRTLKLKECFFCGKRERLEIHHIDADPQNNQYGNLLALCVNCHRKLHAKIYNKIYKLSMRYGKGNSSKNKKK